MLCGIEFIRAYINDLLITPKGKWYNHLNKLELVLKNLRENELKCNIENSFFALTEMEHLGFWVTRIGIQPEN